MLRYGGGSVGTLHDRVESPAMYFAPFGIETAAARAIFMPKPLPQEFDRAP